MAKKRGNGEGSISRRKNGGWIAQYAVYTAEGVNGRLSTGRLGQSWRRSLPRQWLIGTAG